MKIPLPRKITSKLHQMWDKTPPSIKNNPILNKLIIRIFIGSWLNLDWKKEYKSISDDEWEEYYDLAHKKAFRDEDSTFLQKKEIIDNIYGTKILEVGCGSGYLSILIAKENREVTAMDCSGYVLDNAKKNAYKENVQINFLKGFVESLPFDDSEFETTICSHTLEHVKDLKQSINELKRVTSHRLIIIVPRQEYNDYTPDLHTQFFNDKDTLINCIDIPHYKCYYVDNDIFYCGYLD